MKSSSVAALLLSPLLSAALITNTNTTQELDTSADAGWQRVCVWWLYGIFFGVCVRVSADAPFARAAVRECQGPMGGSQRAGAARAAAATQAASLLTRWSSSRAPGVQDGLGYTL